jgi:hypothetical protein
MFPLQVCDMPRIHYKLNTTPEYRRIRLKFDAAKAEFEAARAELNGLRDKCDHQAAEMVGKKEPDGERAVCEKCERELGWWCPDSPKHYCEYENNGYDCCDHCNDPWERK